MTLTVKSKACAFCKGPAEGNYSVHMNPHSNMTLDLCDGCGGYEAPLLSHIWHAIEYDYFVSTFADEIVVGCHSCARLCRLENPTTSILWTCPGCVRTIAIPHFAEMASAIRDVQTITALKAARERPERWDARWNF